MVKENKWNHRRDGSDRYEFGLSRKGEITLNIGTIKELMMSKKPFKNGSSESSGDCRQEIKRRLLLGRKLMTDLDSILKSRDIPLPTKVQLVKAMVFPVVMYGCESWTVKKAEH